jgi:hypothetical protein
MAAGIIILLAASLVATLTHASNVRVPADDIRLADVAQVRGGGAQAAGEIVIARVPHGSPKTISRAELVQLIRRAIPGIEIEGTSDGVISLGSSVNEAPMEARQCFEAAEAISARAPITIPNVRAVACSSARAAAAVVRDSNRGVATAAAAIRTGDYLGEVLFAKAPLVSRGDKLTLVSTAGPVTITRQVRAVQTASTSQRRLFVRTSDGEVFAAPLDSEMSK